jgi:hypothetical protein
VEWVAFDEFEPIGTRTTPDLLALLIALTANLYRKKGDRPMLPRDILPDPLLPPRLTREEEARRTAEVAADYRRLRAERLAKMAAETED